MLDALRRGASGWIAQLFIAVLVISFAIWGVADVFRGFHADAVATVGRTDISINDYARQYDFAKKQLGQQLGQPVNDEQARLFQLPQQVLGRLVADATLDDSARHMGLGISNKTLADEIATDPRFFGSSGTFDRITFGQYVRQLGYTEAD